MELINVIEISPLKYSKEEYELPEVSDPPNPEVWYRKWVKAVSSIDLDFDTIDKDSYFVDIEDVDDRNLKIILEIDLQEIDLGDFEDQIMPFDGGIVLKKNDEILIKPTCCGDISNIKEWQRILENESKEWSDLWIGHPSVFYKKENGKIQFSDYSDLNLNEFLDIQPIFEIEESNLRIEFEKVKQQQIKFKNTISEILKKMKIDNAERISELMTGVK
ncbi:hypothetical protein [Chryseobacterium limigenitum]|uniref:Uncharacterized protein n=1 Tax=Chryseobacterium limigenitum TaxID=1612149 RepID=A0A1K2IUF1_9FLAO|nr:hypothetical protein [Chryseobacterium limigenitum]SFZ95934.1 hypothetical protein SAMN05216324_11443 [Chryseobacterium limigenitum]